MNKTRFFYATPIAVLVAAFFTLPILTAQQQALAIPDGRHLLSCESGGFLLWADTDEGLIVDCEGQAETATPSPTAVATLAPVETPQPTETATLTPTLTATATLTPTQATPVPSQTPTTTPSATMVAETPVPTSMPPEFLEPVADRCNGWATGSNLAWYNGGYGANFPSVEGWPQHVYSGSAVQLIYRDVHEKRGEVIRWFVFADGRGGPEFSGQRVTGLDATTAVTLADALARAEVEGIRLMPVLFDFHIAHAAADGGSGVQLGGRSWLLNDAAATQSFIDEALIPLLQAETPDGYTIGTHPALFAWDIINEPEWIIPEVGSLDGRTGDPVPLANAQRFVAMLTGTLHRNATQPVTVGSASVEFVGDAGPWGIDALRAWDVDGAIDFWSPHHYDAGLPPAVNELDTDRPVIIGELPFNRIEEASVLKALGYAGVLGWDYDGDGFGGGTGSFDQVAADEFFSICTGRDAPTPTPVPTVDPTAVCRIMPLGDSITEITAYRQALVPQLDLAGINYDMVGSSTNNWVNDWDADHEGHGGLTAYYTALNGSDSLASRWTRQAEPDIVLLHMGTNDIWSGGSQQDAADNVLRIVAQVRAEAPDAKIIVAQIIDGQPFDVFEINSAIRTAVEGLVDPLVTLVDMATGWDPSIHTYDGVHPNSVGGQFMADRWYTAMENVGWCQS